jgi:hypothetical protein
MFDINIHLLLGADVLSGDVMVGVQFYMLLLKIPEHAYDGCCHSNCSSALFLVLFSPLFGVGFPFLCLLIG